MNFDISNIEVLITTTLTGVSALLGRLSGMRSERANARSKEAEAETHLLKNKEFLVGLYQESIAELREQYEQKVGEYKKIYDEQVGMMRESVANMREAYERKIAILEREIKAHKSTIEMLRSENRDLKRRLEKLD